MEELRKRAFGIGGVFIIAGLAFQFAHGGVAEVRTEQWMEQRTPVEVGRYKMVASNDNPMQSYRQSPMVYEELQPYGIVARVFTQGDKLVDVLVIASNNKASFHDPRVCFTAQSFVLLSQRVVVVPTRTRGDIEVTETKLKGPQGETTALFLYRGPGGFHATTSSLAWAMFKYQFTTWDEAEGAFYRFIPGERTSTEDLYKFAGEFLDDAGRMSSGFF